MDLPNQTQTLIDYWMPNFILSDSHFQIHHNMYMWFIIEFMILNVKDIVHMIKIYTKRTSLQSCLFFVFFFMRWKEFHWNKKKMYITQQLSSCLSSKVFLFSKAIQLKIFWSKSFSVIKPQKLFSAVHYSTKIDKAVQGCFIRYSIFCPVIKLSNVTF